jgi:hypothetical protein
MKRFKGVISVFLTVIMCISLLPNSVFGSEIPTVTVNELSSTQEADDLVNNLLGGGITYSNVSFIGRVGEGASAGAFSGGTGIFGFDEGIVLSTGAIGNIIGPNSVSNKTSINSELSGDIHLNSLINNDETQYNTYDATVLEFDFVPNADEITFQYQFASEEYNEFVEQAFNDVFGFFVNGVNIALIPETTLSVAINNINLNDYSEYYINNENKLLNTEMDGMTVLLTAKAAVNKEKPNHIKLAIADSGDRSFDSNVLIKTGSFISDNTPPVLSIPEDKTVFATGEKTVVDIGAATATDDTTPTDEIIISNNAPIDGFMIGITEVIWTATDLSGNSVSLNQKINVISPDEATQIHVWKNWHGLETAYKSTESDVYGDWPDVVINLLANGKKVQSKTLGSENYWQYTFIAPKYDDKNEEISYSIEEEPIEQYIPVIRYYNGEGYAINNIPCLDIPVEKLWEGPVGEEAEVTLYINGKTTDYVLKLNNDNQWKNTFKIPLLDLEEFEPVYWMYEAKFTVLETSQENYESVVTGDMYDGFTIINKYNGPIEGYDYAVINWMYETGYNTNNYDLKYTETTSASAISSEEIEYYKNKHYDSGYTFISSDVKTEDIVVIIGETTSGTAITGSAIKTTATLKYDKNGSSGGSSSSKKPIEPELEKFDHFAYVLGYPEGDIKPLNNITREEVAMIFYRLLTDECRNEYLSDVNSFIDLNGNGWSTMAISTLYKANIITGYPDGSFRPTESITRAEFATIAAKFDKLNLSNTTKFTDITGHWADKYITSAEIKGWINGYPDLTFKPEQDITRAEAMALINNVLGRKVKKENIHEEAIYWIDITSSDWYYEDVMEATNSHVYVNERNNGELWTGIKQNKVWP